jgi:hypothetical protein
MYELRRPGCPIDDVRTPNTDPLAAARYSCIYWVDHLCDSDSLYGKRRRRDDDLLDGGTIHAFLQDKFPNWLEALSLLRSMSEGILSMAKLQASFQVG